MMNILNWKFTLLDKRHDQGFWSSYPVTKVKARFVCPAEADCSWHSNDVQVDIMVNSICTYGNNFQIDLVSLQLCCQERRGQDHQRVSAEMSSSWRSSCRACPRVRWSQVSDDEDQGVHQTQILQFQAQENQ